MIKAILFDFDGTLINTNELIYKSYSYAYKKVLGRDITKGEFLKFYGRPLKEALIDEFGKTGETLLKEFQVFNLENHDQFVKSFAGAAEGVRFFKQKGFLIGVVTSKRINTLLMGIKFLGLENTFDVLVTPEDTDKYKPNPEPVLKGCELLKVFPEETVYVGDSVFDLMAGRAAGTKICAVKYSLTPKEELLKFEPDYYTDSILSLAEEIIRDNKNE